LLVPLLAALILAPAAACGEEGMWTFDAFPSAAVERDLGVRLDQPWLDHLREGSVRLTSGCSGALVSPRGLVVTNHHCILSCVQSVSSDGHDRLAEGFGVGAAEPPRACPGLQAEILEGIVDITGPLFAVSAGKTGDAFIKARETLIAEAERNACAGDRRYHCQVISFYGGGEFKLYKYRRYDDVRLVFAPEFAVAFFGGDPENFSFPRYDLDMAVLRLYDHGAPAVPRDWLAWSERPPATGEAVFVSGSPGSTERGLTAIQLETLRDVANPQTRAAAERLRDRLIAFSAKGPEPRRLAADRVFNSENLLKILAGEDAVLADPAFLAARRDDEAALKAAVADDPKLAAQVGDPWSEIAALQKTYVEQYPLWRALEAEAGTGSRLYWYARTLVRGAQERARPAIDRLPEYADARLPLLEKALLDDQPVDPALEAVCLQAWLDGASAQLGPNDPALAAFLSGTETPALAHTLAFGSRLGDPAVRAQLWRGGLPAILASKDPMILYLLKTDPVSRAARQVWEDKVLGPIDTAAERIALARFAVHRDGVYPDATYSPRVSFGRVQGWSDKGADIAPFTTWAGLFGHAGEDDPLRLPERWLAARAALNPAAVLDFVTTNDIVGGNSGSPVADAQGRVVGLAFDGNQAATAGDFAYNGASNRTVVVSTVAIDEALAKVYGREDLVREMRDR
jgi:hypothetical protein